MEDLPIIFFFFEKTVTDCFFVCFFFCEKTVTDCVFIFLFVPHLDHTLCMVTQISKLKLVFLKNSGAIWNQNSYEGFRENKE